MSPSAPRDFHIDTPDGVRLAGEQAGEMPSQAGAGPAQAGEDSPVVLLHGLTATRRYVVMGSGVLARSGHRTIAYDARGHGRSTPAPTPDAYTYELLMSDLLAVLDELQIERTTIAGASMGAHTAVAFALAHPERVAALALITPSYDPEMPVRADAYAEWDRLADGLRSGGVEGFLDAYDLQAIPVAWRDTAATVMRQRLTMHEHPLAVADALGAVPRSKPFEAWNELKQIDVPTLVVASRDEPDPTHPLAVGERYASTIPGAALAVEREGSSPLAWQGGQLSRLLDKLVTDSGLGRAPASRSTA